MYVHYEQQEPYADVARRGLPSRYLVIRHHPLLLARLAWRPALALLTAAGITLTRAMAPSSQSEAAAALLTVLAVGLLVAGGLGGAWTYLNWSFSTLVVGSGRLIVRGGVPGIRRYQRELLLTRVSRIDTRWPVLAPRSWRCADLVLGIAGAPDIRFPLAAEAGVARDALLSLSRSGASAVGGVGPPGVASGPAVTIARALSPAEIRTHDGGRPSRANAPGRLSRAGNASGPPPTWRRHLWWPLRRSFWPAAVAAVGCLIQLRFGPVEAALSAPNARLAGVVLATVAAAWLAVVWLGWWHDRLLIYDGRLVYRSGMPWFSGARDSVVPLAAADEFVLRVGSPLAHLFDYGDVAVGLTGAWPFVYRCARHPEALIRALREASVVAQVQREAVASGLLDRDDVFTPSLTYRERGRAGRYRRLTWPRSFAHGRARDRA